MRRVGVGTNVRGTGRARRLISRGSHGATQESSTAQTRGYACPDDRERDRRTAAGSAQTAQARATAPHHALLIRPDAPSELHVCGDAGVYVTKDAGATWRNATSNLPHVLVVDLVYQFATKTLLAATYGRSVWSLKLA